MPHPLAVFTAGALSATAVVGVAYFGIRPDIPDESSNAHGSSARIQDIAPAQSDPSMLTAPVFPVSELEQEVTYALNNPVSSPRTVTLPSQWYYSVMNWESRDQYVWTQPDRNRQLWVEIPAEVQVTEMNSISDGRILSCYSGIDQPAPRCTNGLAILVDAEIYNRRK